MAITRKEVQDLLKLGTNAPTGLKCPVCSKEFHTGDILNHDAIRSANCHDDLKQQRDNLVEVCEATIETLYQRSEARCVICGEESYPVRGNKRGYSQVAAEDAEEWTIDHADTCLVLKIDNVIAKAKKGA